MPSLYQISDQGQRQRTLRGLATQSKLAQCACAPLPGAVTADWGLLAPQILAPYTLTKTLLGVRTREGL